MKKAVAAFALLVVVAGCGASGPPITPSANAGVTVGTNGVTPRASVSGTVSVGVNR